MKDRIIGAVFGAITSIALIFAFVYFYDKNLKKVEATGHINLVVAKFDLLPGTILSSNVAAIRTYERSIAPSRGVPPESFSSIEGKILAFPLKAGDSIHPEMLQDGSLDAKSDRENKPLNTATSLEASTATGKPGKTAWDILAEVLSSPLTIVLFSVWAALLIALIHTLSKQDSEVSILWGFVKYHKNRPH